MSDSATTLGSGLRQVAGLVDELEELGVDVDEVDRVSHGQTSDDDYVRFQLLLTLPVTQPGEADVGEETRQLPSSIHGVPSALLPRDHDGEDEPEDPEEPSVEEDQSQELEPDQPEPKGTEQEFDPDEAVDRLPEAEEDHGVGEGPSDPDEDAETEEDSAPFERDEDGNLDHQNREHLEWAYEHHPTMSAATEDFGVKYQTLYARFTATGVHEAGSNDSPNEDEGQEEEDEEQSDTATSPSPEQEQSDEYELDVADHDDTELDYSDLSLPTHVTAEELTEAVRELETLEEIGNRIEVSPEKVRVWLVRAGTYRRLNSPESRPAKRRIAETEREYREPTPYELVDASDLPPRVDLPDVLSVVSEVGGGGHVADVARKLDVDGNTVADLCWQLKLKQRGKDLLVDDELQERVEILRQEVA